MKSAIVILAAMLPMLAACSGRPEMTEQKTTTTSTSSYTAPAPEPAEVEKRTTTTIQVR